MRYADQVLDDDALLLLIQQELAKRIKKSKTRGRPATPADVVLRMLLDDRQSRTGLLVPDKVTWRLRFWPKHARDWSYAVLTREVRANLVYREFTRVGGGRVPDDKTMGRLGRQLGPEVVQDLNQRVVQIAIKTKATAGKKLRVDTTVVETNIHYPTDSTLLGDGVRVLTRVMKKVNEVAGTMGARFRDRTRAVKLRVLAIARASRNKTESGKQKLKQSYIKLLDATSRVVGQARKFSREIAARVKRGNRAVLARARKQLEVMIPRVQQIIRQTKARVLHGNTHAEGKSFSVFEYHTEVIRKGKTDKPNEFGKLIKIQEAENQIVTHYEVYDERPADSTLLISSVEQHIQQFGRVPDLVAADPGFFSAANEAAVEKMGVKRVSIPSHATKSVARKHRQKERWFKKAQKWRTGCEGRISVLKRRHGLERSRYKGPNGMKRWVRLGVIADNIIHIGDHLAAQVSS